jgi:hypothetical protein
MAESNGLTSGSSPTAAGASSNLSWQPKGTILIADGFGNIEGSVSANQGQFVASIQHFRVNYTPSAQDWSNLYVNLRIPFPSPFADNNYTVTCTLEVNTAALPLWQANTIISHNTAIFDPTTQTIQFAMNTAMTGSTKPVFDRLPGSLTTDNEQQWENETGSFGILNIQERTPASITAQFLLKIGVNPDNPSVVSFTLNVLAFHD